MVEHAASLGMLLSVGKSNPSKLFGISGETNCWGLTNDLEKHQMICALKTVC